MRCTHSYPLALCCAILTCLASPASADDPATLSPERELARRLAALAENDKELDDSRRISGLILGSKLLQKVGDRNSAISLLDRAEGLLEMSPEPSGNSSSTFYGYRIQRLEVIDRYYSLKADFQALAACGQFIDHIKDNEKLDFNQKVQVFLETFRICRLNQDGRAVEVLLDTWKQLFASDDPSLRRPAGPELLIELSASVGSYRKLLTDVQTKHL